MVDTSSRDNGSPFYAAGDIVRGLNHVIVAAAQSAIAATVIRSKLRGC
jgi:thioredoxin reductase